MMIELAWQENAPHLAVQVAIWSTLPPAWLQLLTQSSPFETSIDPKMAHMKLIWYITDFKQKKM